MNCENVANILDDRAEHTLSAAERCALDLHLAACADCASAWRAHEALASQRVPAAPLYLIDGVLAELSSRAPSAAVTRRPISRIAVGAAILAVGGAFAALTIVTQRSELIDDAPSAAAAPTGAATGAADLADTPMRPSGLDDPVIELTGRSTAAPSADAVRFPDGDLFVLLRVPPEYPRVALHEGREADVRLSYTITRHGTVTDVAVEESSDPLFDASAALAVERWKYMPRVVNGEPVDVPGVLTVIRFRLAMPGDDEKAAAQAPAAEPSQERPVGDMLAEAWDCAAVRNLLCAQQVLDRVSATYELTPAERQLVLSFCGYLYTQYGDFERAIDAFRAAAADDPASGVWVTLMHLYFTRQQYQLALDTGVRYLAGIEARFGRSDNGVEQFVEKLEQLGIRPTNTPDSPTNEPIF
jgi:TonB family protein